MYNPSTKPTLIDFVFPTDTKAKTHKSKSNKSNKLNVLFREITKEFVQKYIDISSFGITFIAPYYNSDSLISLCINRNSDNLVYELIGHNAFNTKLTELRINSIKYYDLICNSQPVGKSKILITINGKADIHS